jgi:hypothetical protein
VGWELLAVLFTVVLLPLVVLGFCLFWWSTSRDRDLLARAWRDYASARRRVFVSPAGEWPNRSLPAIHWSEDGVRFRIEARGSETRLRTRVVARAPVATLGELLARSGRAGEAPGIHVDAAIDARFHVRARPSGFASRIFTTDVRRALLGFAHGRGVTLAYVRGDVWLSWPGGDENDARLDEACAVVRAVVHAMARAYDAAA